MPRERKGTLIEKRGNLFARIRWTSTDGRPREICKRVKDRTEGRKLLRQLLADLDEKGAATFDHRLKTFSDLADAFIENVAIPPIYANGIKVSGQRDYERTRQHVETLRTYFFKTKLSDLTYGSLEKFKRDRLCQPIAKTNRPRSLADTHRTLSVLRAMLNFALREGWLDRNPFK